MNHGRNHRGMSTSPVNTVLVSTTNPRPAISATQGFENGAAARHGGGSAAPLEGMQNLDIQEILAAIFKDAEQTLATSLDHALALVARRIKSTTQLESENLILRSENKELRAKNGQACFPGQTAETLLESFSPPDDSASDRFGMVQRYSNRSDGSLRSVRSRESNDDKAQQAVRPESTTSSPTPLPGGVDEPPPPTIAFSSVVPQPPGQNQLKLLTPEAAADSNQPGTPRRLSFSSNGPPVGKKLSARFAEDDDEVHEENPTGTGGRSVQFDGGLPAGPQKSGRDSLQSQRSQPSARSSNRTVVFEVLPLWEDTRSSKKFSQKLGRFDIGKSVHHGHGHGHGSVNLHESPAISKTETQGTIDVDETAQTQDEYTSEHTFVSRPSVMIRNAKSMKGVSPSATIRSFWDAVSCLFVFYDIVVIPLEFMEPEEAVWMSTMRWLTRLFWTFDIFASFGTGFVAGDGMIELQLDRIAYRYLRTWFLMDFLLVFTDWFEVVWGDGDSLGFLRVGRGSRALRIIRLVRLLRLIRVGSIMILIAERVRSERLIILADIMKIIFAILMVAHVMACLWYGIGLDSDGVTWVQNYDFPSNSLLARYSSSMHWSLTQFSGGMDEIRPFNIPERVYTIFSYVVAFILAAVFVSRLTSSMTRLHMLSNTQAQQLVALRRYLGQNGITSKLALRIQKNAQHAISEQQHQTPEDKVELLQLVSEPLLMELHFELFFPALQWHPFFGPYMEECPHVMRKVCHLAMQIAQVHPGDVVFNAGEIPLHPRMYILTSGTLLYTAMVSADTVSVEPFQWLSEGTLWTHWMHRGVLVAKQNCRLCILDATKFQNIAGRFEHPHSFNPRAYATHFVDELNSTEGEITDLLIVSFPLSMLRRRGSRNFQGAHTGGLRGFFADNFASRALDGRFLTKSLTRILKPGTSMMWGKPQSKGRFLPKILAKLFG